jgi:hypothetical protein
MTSPMHLSSVHEDNIFSSSIYDKTKQDNSLLWNVAEKKLNEYIKIEHLQFGFSHKRKASI